MIVNLKDIVKFVNKHVNIDNLNSKEIDVIIPIISHLKSNERVVINSDESFSPSMSNNQLTLTGNYDNRTYHIYEDFYNYIGDRDPSSVIDFMQHYNKFVYKDSFTEPIPVFYKSIDE